MKGICGIKTALASLGQPSAWSMEKALQRRSKKVETNKGEAEGQEPWRGHSCGYPRQFILLEEGQRKTRHSGKKGGSDGVSGPWLVLYPDPQSLPNTKKRLSSLCKSKEP